MTDRRRLSMTRDKAAALQSLLARVSTTGGVQAAAPAGAIRLVVKILTDVPAGNYQQHDAAILNAAGADTLMRVKVRHVGEGAVAANTIVYPEPCGQHGLCYVRTSNGVPQINFGVRRFCRLVGPIAGEMTGSNAENTDWTLGQTMPQNWVENNTGGAFSGYHALFSLGSTPDTAGTGTPPSLPWTAAVWVLRMKPMRFKVDVPVGLQFGQNYRVRYARSKRTSWLFNYIEEIQQSFGNVGIDSKTVKSGSWVHPMTISGVQVPGAAMVSPSTLYGRFTEEKSGVTNRQYTVTTTISHARVWIDGVDRTGIVSMSATQNLVQDGPVGNQAYGGIPFCGGPCDPLFFTPAQLADKSVEFDVWVRIEIRHNGAAPTASDFWGTPTRSVCWAIADCRGMPATLYSADLYPNLPAAQRWEFAFSSNGPGGVSTIRNEPTSGWTYQPGTGYFTLSQSSGSGYLSMDYLREIPLIEVRNGYSMSGLYVPDDDSHFANVTLQNGAEWKPGIWAPNAATTFRLIGSRQNYYGLPYLWLRALDTASGWSNLPETITVTPV
jgi:hypothetical protein